jgi:hypothetical protein
MSQMMSSQCVPSSRASIAASDLAPRLKTASVLGGDSPNSVAIFELSGQCCARRCGLILSAIMSFDPLDTFVEVFSKTAAEVAKEAVTSGLKEAGFSEVVAGVSAEMSQALAEQLLGPLLRVLLLSKPLPFWWLTCAQLGQRCL